MVTKNEILIVDDEAQLRELVKWELESLGYGVREASNGKEALEILRTYKPDMIVTDLVMPEMDGLTFLKALRIRVGQHPPAIITTGYSPELENEKIKLNIISVINKPYFPNDVSAVVAKHLATKAA